MIDGSAGATFLMQSGSLGLGFGVLPMALVEME